MIYRIADILYKNKSKVWLFEVNRPDIIFKTPDGKKVAIEIETGQCYVKKKRELIKRVKRLNKEFGKNWFFVVTNSDWLRRYKRLAPTITRKEVIAKLKKFIP